jgi:hypothetical protein
MTCLLELRCSEEEGRARCLLILLNLQRRLRRMSGGLDQSDSSGWSRRLT